MVRSAKQESEPSGPLRLFTALGATALGFLQETGEILLMLGQAARLAVTPPFRPALILAQMEFVGIGSLFIILLTGTFTGMVFTVQTVVALERVGMESMVGSTVVLAVARELSPVLAALMVTGRVGSAYATELGTMRVTEQIDAIEVMAVSPVQYLVVPRLIATTLMMPVLTLVFDAVALLGSYAVAVFVQGIDEGAYMARIEWMVDPYDFYHGVYKAFVFGLLIAILGCFKGYNAAGGAKGVGIATTRAVVVGSIMIFVLDYVMSTILILLEPAPL